jgi:hypothetical protein
MIGRALPQVRSADTPWADDRVPVTGPIPKVSPGQTDEFPYPVDTRTARFSSQPCRIE